MAELDTSGGGKKGGGKVRSKKASTRVDLTAMVDLAFLLITFFILTTTLQKPKAMDLTMPDKQEDNKKVELDVAESRTMTILIGKDNKVEWYIGQLLKPIAGPTIEGFGKNGLIKTLVEKQAEIKRTQGKDMIVIIKPSAKSTYENVVTVMDQLNIIGNQIRAIQDISQDDVGLLTAHGLY
ncbi:ExbD/TolR family protein [Mucilaginibacter calamicampi]|uniref:ExbD/TolR family protein n=1 Tax=Mucilaginibacter calamicampi TaxID=1302352 RepID=A0ABW2Z0U5_9SPHI